MSKADAALLLLFCCISLWKMVSMGWVYIGTDEKKFAACAVGILIPTVDDTFY
jgi:hypothetical protein